MKATRCCPREEREDIVCWSHLPLFASKKQNQESNVLVLTWSPTESLCPCGKCNICLGADQDDDQGEFSAEGPRLRRGASFSCEGLWLCSSISIQEEAEVIPTGPGLNSWCFFSLFFLLLCIFFLIGSENQSVCPPGLSICRKLFAARYQQVYF